MMNRRRFLLTSLAGVLAAPLAAEAQQAAKVWRVGILASASPRVYDNTADELRKFGYVLGRNLSLEVRSAEGKLDRLPFLASELARAGVDVIVVAGGDTALRAAQQATKTIPIVVVAIDSDPIASGLVSSLARPGGNITGIFLQQLELMAKRLELLKTALPQLTRLALLWDLSTADQFKAAETAARPLGLSVQSLQVSNPPEGLSEAFTTAVRDRAGAILVVTSAVFYRERTQIARLAMNSRLPAMSTLREYAEAGSLMSYGTNLPEMFRRAATYVDKIFKGAQPGELPMEQPTAFEFVINLKTAKALGLTIPPSLLARADQVIE